MAEQALQDLEKKASAHESGEEVKRAASSHKASTRVRADGVHPKVPLDLSTAIRGNFVVLLQKVEQCGHESGKDDSLVSCAEECHESNCLIAHSHSIVGMAESVSDTRMRPRKQSEMGPYKKQWKSGENSMASLLKNGIRKYSDNVEEINQETLTLVVDLAKAFEKVYVKSSMGLGNTLRFPAKKSVSTL